MRVHDVPFVRLLAEHHGRAGDEFIPAIVDVLRRRLRAGPIAPCAAVTPDNGEIGGDNAADVEGRPVARLYVLLVEFPQPKPMLAAVIGVPIEIEEGGFRRLAPERVELFPIEARIRIDIGLMQLDELRAIALRAADEICLGHFRSALNSRADWRRPPTADGARTRPAIRCSPFLPRAPAARREHHRAWAGPPRCRGV